MGLDLERVEEHPVEAVLQQAAQVRQALQDPRSRVVELPAVDPAPFFRYYPPVHLEPHSHLSVDPRSLRGSACSACSGRDGPQPHIRAITYHPSDYRPRGLEGKAKRAGQARDDGGPGRLKI